MTGDYSKMAEWVADQIPDVLINRGLEPSISRYVLTQTENHVFLFVVLDIERIGKIERYISPDVIHHISTVLGGLRVYVSNSSGLRYVILLSEKKSLPMAAEYPGFRLGVLQVGIGTKGRIETTWQEAGNILAAGMTRSGKSTFLRLVASQAFESGFDLMIVDPDGSTFPYLVGHPQVLGYADSLVSSSGVIERAHEEMIKRTAAANNNKMKGIEPPAFTRLLLVVDEYSGLVLANGGAKGSLAQTVTAIAWGGLKFGIQTVLAGHEFTKDIVGPVTAQMKSRFCFQVKAPSISGIVAGRRGAEKITNPGRALTDPFGWVQTYNVDQASLNQVIGETNTDGLTQEERALIGFIKLFHDGRVTFEALKEKGFTRGQAEQIRKDWQLRGIAVHSPEDNNSVVIKI